MFSLGLGIPALGLLHWRKLPKLSHFLTIGMPICIAPFVTHVIYEFVFYGRLAILGQISRQTPKMDSATAIAQELDPLVGSSEFRLPAVLVFAGAIASAFDWLVKYPQPLTRSRCSDHAA